MLLLTRYARYARSAAVTFIAISSASPYREWGHKFYISKTVCQSPPALPLPKNSKQPPFIFSQLTCVILGSSSLAFFIRCPSQCDLQEETIIYSQHVSNPCPAPSPYLFADIFHVSTLAPLFTPA